MRVPLKIKPSATAAHHNNSSEHVDWQENQISSHPPMMTSSKIDRLGSLAVSFCI